MPSSLNLAAVTVTTKRCIPVLVGAQQVEMRVFVTLDDELLKTAHEYTGITERAELIREALKSIIAHEAGTRLIALAGNPPEMKDVPRRKLNRK